ncbi:MAG TPA: universal stress protein [Solirubrobacteraceae bacterium]|jgi:nucleotide-binding universal stress UspA family protein|nr:universal stress protein [Solirubrobacteraceae bacterium]
MTPHAIVSYDDTQNDRDALMLGRTLRDAGARLTLAYVRHAVHHCPDAEELSHHKAHALLERGAGWLEDPDMPRRVVMNASTGEGLAWLAEAEQAEIIVFGSDYRTRRGHVAVGRSAQSLLDGGPSALALAPADYAAGVPGICTVGVLRGTADEAAIETAFSVADRLDATVVDRDGGVDLLVVGSRPEARAGRVMLTSHAANAIEEATSPVLIVARGVPVRFETFVTA